MYYLAVLSIYYAQTTRTDAAEDGIVVAYNLTTGTKNIYSCVSSLTTVVWYLFPWHQWGVEQFNPDADHLEADLWPRAHAHKTSEASVKLW